MGTVVFFVFIFFVVVTAIICIPASKEIRIDSGQCFNKRPKQNKGQMYDARNDGRSFDRDDTFLAASATAVGALAAGGVAYDSLHESPLNLDHLFSSDADGRKEPVLACSTDSRSFGLAVPVEDIQESSFSSDSSLFESPDIVNDPAFADFDINIFHDAFCLDDIRFGTSPSELNSVI